MKVSILHGVDGAGRAEGIAVIIDVFRAFTVEAVMYEKGAAAIIPTASIEETLALKSEMPDAMTAGERNGIQLAGFDFGNSPSQIAAADIRGRTIIHTTSAGTQGIIAARQAKRIFTGALLNAQATSSFIKSLNPPIVSLVAMGMKGAYDTPEDTLCAMYMKSLLEETPYPNIRQEADDLRFTEGRKFFDPAQQEAFPEADFAYCVNADSCHFAIEIQKDGSHLTTVKRVL